MDRSGNLRHPIHHSRRAQATDDAARALHPTFTPVLQETLREQGKKKGQRVSLQHAQRSPWPVRRDPAHGNRFQDRQTPPPPPRSTLRFGQQPQPCTITQHGLQWSRLVSSLGRDPSVTPYTDGNSRHPTGSPRTTRRSTDRSRNDHEDC